MVILYKLTPQYKEWHLCLLLNSEVVSGAMIFCAGITCSN